MTTYVLDWLKLLRGERLGYAYSPKGWIMPFTHEDVAWMCRALAGESSGVIGPPSDAVAWAMINFAFSVRDETYDRRGGGWTLRPPHRFSDVLLAYCQPINPYWRFRGDAAEQRRRLRYATMKPREVEETYPGLIQHVLDIFRGKVDGEPYRGLIHFAKCGTGESAHGSPDVSFGGNCFWYGTGTSMWAPGTVRVIPPGAVPIERLLVPVALQAGAVAAVAFERKLLELASTIPFLGR